MSKKDLVVSVPDEALRRAFGDIPDGVDVIEWDMAGPAPVDAIDVVVPPYMSGTAVLAALDGVATQLVQSQSIGFDGVADALPPGHVFANAVSVHETSTAELALALILASQRGLPDFVRAAGEGTWAPARHASLADRTVLLVGYGGVGKAIEERLRGFETTVVRVASRARDGENGHVHGIDELAALLPQADIVVVGVPLGENTRHLIDDRFLSLMEDGSLLVNISRGAVADTGALLEHARRGRLRLALDVTDPEPLPDGHPLFALPNVLITPHVGGASSAMMPRMARLLHRQVKALLRGEDPENVVLRS
ncbi:MULTISPECIES: 2-hydroxyacid dehydrogenase [unclassified Arthrobacter]|uniref:2-hydroxyacid dehydrogenase n=1 Tax=unclassified Arthrobacter TaxID=235627 RepID=UPI002119DA36|nr:2-hydroxyacid dehydrogenase [Arthrobacter sp. STN4]MCQ9165911.1 2-hydroxyacid dehydrogenase [Arthrobacter sp. STN4]